MISLSGTLAEVEADARALFPAKRILTPDDLHTLQPHKGCSPEACEIEEVRKHEAEQVAISARQSMTIQDLLSEKAVDARLIETLRGEIKDLQAKLTPGSSVLTLPVLTPDERESEGVAGVLPSEKLLGEKGAIPSGAVMSVVCNSKCRHVDPFGGWPHDTKLDEDRGDIHTDDCGFWGCKHSHDPGECCTSGQPGAVCRVKTHGETVSPSAPSRPVPPQHVGAAPLGGSSDDLAHAFQEDEEDECAVCGSTSRLAHLISEVDGESTKGGHADPTPGNRADFGGSTVCADRDRTGVSEPVVPAVPFEAASKRGDSTPQQVAGESPTNGLESRDSRSTTAAYDAASAGSESMRGQQESAGKAADGGQPTTAANATSARHLEGKETSALLKTGESIATRARKAVESASADLTMIEDGLFEREGRIVNPAFYELRYFLLRGGPCNGESAAFSGTSPDAAKRAAKWIENEGWTGCTAEEISKAESDKLTYSDLKPVASDLALRDGVTPAVPENGDANPIEGRVTPDAPGEVAASAAEATPAVSTIATAHEAEGQPGQSGDAQRTDHPEVTPVSEKAAPEKRVATDAGLAPNIAEEIGNGERAVDPPAPVNQCEVPNKGCPKEGLFDEESGGYFCAGIHLLVHKEIRRTWAKIAHPDLVGKRWRGRPLGSKNKPKAAEAALPAKQEAASNG